jgi:hypothetical protein
MDLTNRLLTTIQELTSIESVLSAITGGTTETMSTTPRKDPPTTVLISPLLNMVPVTRTIELHRHQEQRLWNLISGGLYLSPEDHHSDHGRSKMPSEEEEIAAILEGDELPFYGESPGGLVIEAYKEAYPTLPEEPPVAEQLPA